MAVREVVAFPIVETEKQQCAKQIAEKELEQNELGDICKTPFGVPSYSRRVDKKCF